MNPQPPPGEQCTDPGPPPTSWLAVASWIANVVAVPTLGLTAPLGLLLGLLGVWHVRCSRGQRRGLWAAVSGSAIAAVMLAFMVPIYLSAAGKAKQLSCYGNLTQAGLALRMYASDNEGRLPEPLRWCDAITPYNGPITEVLICPAYWRRDAYYGLNPALTGLDIDALEQPDALVMAFDSTGGWNASGGPETVSPRHYSGHWTTAFVAGNVAYRSQVDPKAWKPHLKSPDLKPPTHPSP